MFQVFLVGIPLVLLAILFWNAKKLWGLLKGLWGVFKTYMAKRKLFWASMTENSALGIQLGDKEDGKLVFMYITPGEENRADMEGIADKYNTTGHPKKIQVLKEGHDGLVWVGIPGYASVKKWYMTPLHQQVLADNERHGTIPLKVVTTRFPAMLEGKALEDLNKRVIDAKRGGPKLLADEVDQLMALDHPETAEGFVFDHGDENDWHVLDPWRFLIDSEKPGQIMLGFLNQASRVVGAHTRAISLDLDPTKGAEAQFTRLIEPRIQALLGLAEWKPEYTDKEQLIKPDDDKIAKAVLESYGVGMLRLRVKNLGLPEAIMELVRKPATERAKAAGELIAAQKRADVAKLDAQARKTAGEGERDHQIALAEGDRAHVAAFSSDGKTVDAAANAVRLTDHSYQAWQAGVTGAAAGKVIITSGPNASGGSSLEGAAATLGAVLQGAGSGTTDKSKKNKKDKPEGEDKTPPADESDDESTEE